MGGHVAWFMELGWAVHSEVVGLRVLDKGLRRGESHDVGCR